MLAAFGREDELIAPILASAYRPRIPDAKLMYGVQVPVVASKAEGRAGRIEGQRAEAIRHVLESHTHKLPAITPFLDFGQITVTTFLNKF